MHTPLLHSPARLRVPAFIVLILVSVPACGEEIGDACEFNVDCSKRGDRLCDRSSPGGYCTIENCSAEVCPKEAHCIAFYPAAFLTTPCEPETEDLPDPDLATNDCVPDETCISSGFCAPRSSARRFCMKKCEDSGDCRDEYECRRSGLGGAEYVAPLSSTDPYKTVRFCAPKG